MTNNPNWLSIAAVHRRTGKARSTIASHIKKGKLSVVLDENGKQFVEASEAARVYGAEFDLNEDNSKPSATNRFEKAVSTQDNSELVTELKNHRDSLEKIIDDLRSDLEKSQQREEKKMMLLSHQSDASEKIRGVVKQAVSDELKEEIDQLRSSLAAKEIEAKRWKKALHVERSKSWMNRLFGGRRGV